MIRFNFLIEKETVDRIRAEKKKHGFVSVSAFIRYLIIKFFEQKDIDGSEK